MEQKPVSLNVESSFEIEEEIETISYYYSVYFRTP